VHYQQREIVLHVGKLKVEPLLQCVHAFKQVMMMIVFITMNRGLVPLNYGLCTQILYSRFKIIGDLRSHFLLFFFGRKNMLNEKAVSPRSHSAS